MSKDQWTAKEFREHYKTGRISSKGKAIKEEKLLPEFEAMLIRDKQPNTIYLRGNVPSSKNSKQIFFKNGTGGRKIPFITDSNLVKKYKKDIVGQLMEQKSCFKALTKDKKLPLVLQLTFIRSTKQHFDFNNITQVLCDLFQKHQWIAEDDLDHLITLPPLPPAEQYYVNKDCAGVIIKVL